MDEKRKDTLDLRRIDRLNDVKMQSPVQALDDALRVGSFESREAAEMLEAVPASEHCGKGFG